MKAILFLLLTLGVSSASACSHYQFCHCQDDKGTPNDTATNTVCNGEGVAGQMRTLGGDSSGSPYKECLAQAGCWNNCSWRANCKSAGASGADSNCYSKCIFY